MQGCITGRDVVLNSVTIVRLFGMSRYLSCLWAAIRRRPSTFLGSLYPAPACAERRWRTSR